MTAQVTVVQALPKSERSELAVDLATEAGADVTLVSGPVHLPTPRGVQRIDVQSAQQMFDAVMHATHGQDAFIATAAALWGGGLPKKR